MNPKKPINYGEEKVKKEFKKKLSECICKYCFKINEKKWKRKNQRQWDDEGIVVCPNTIRFSKEISKSNAGRKYWYEPVIANWKEKNVNNRGERVSIEGDPEKWCPYEMEHLINL